MVDYEKRALFLERLTNSMNRRDALVDRTATLAHTK